MALPRIIDNHKQKLLDVVKELAGKHEEVSIATGYWDLPGTQLVLPDLSKCKKVRLLIGREPLIPRHHLDRPEADFPDRDFFSDLERLAFNETFRETAAEIKRLIGEGVLEVRVYRKSFFHAKSYIFGTYDSEEAVGIIGSSNFTKNGLTANAELNALESDHRVVTYKPRILAQEVGHLAWFDSFWDQAEPWDEAFTDILSLSPHGDVLFTPYEAYIKTLWELYHDELAEEKLEETKKGTLALHQFQIKNAQDLVSRLRKRQVAMLADSVGLGKTITAIEVIKQYKERGVRVEVICPKALKEQWLKELTTQNVFNLTPITLQNPNEIQRQRDLDRIANVELFVIDESHNLKSRAGKRFRQITDWIANNPKAHVLLLTATPINNHLSDLTNQILLAVRGEAGILRFTTVDKKRRQTVTKDFNQAIEDLTKSMKASASEGEPVDYDQIREVMSPILRAFVVRRTRQGIEKEYGGLVDENGKLQTFPKVVPEVRTYDFSPDITSQIRQLTTPATDLEHVYGLGIDEMLTATDDLLHPLDTIEKSKASGRAQDVSSPIALIYRAILLLGFMPYRWRMYQTKVYGKTRAEVLALKLSADERSGLFSQLSIYGILRTMFLKRLESSVSAIQTSLDTYAKKLDLFERGLKQGKIVSLADADELSELLGDSEDGDEEDRDIPEELVQDEVNAKRYALDAMQGDITKEREIIKLLKAQLEILKNDDSKLQSVAKLVDELAKSQPAGRKVLVFSYYADTLNYLKENLGQYSKSITAQNTGFLSSHNRAEAESLACRFAPISKKCELKPGEHELDYLCSTDILSEGQNLQDCGILINYDLHWNPVRMIQRNGRVNRLGSKFSQVFIYNVSPEIKLDEYLRLVTRLQGKIELIRNTIGTDTPVLAEAANPIEFQDTWQDVYSTDMQARIEAMEKAERESDFLLAEDDYVLDLKRFHRDPDVTERYRDTVYGIPHGKWSIMPEHVHRGENRPEVLALVGLKDAADIVMGRTFVGLTRNGKDIQHVPHLQALEWLRTEKGDMRPADHLTHDRAKLQGRVAEAAISYHGQEAQTALVGQQNDVLRALYDLHYPPEELDAVRVAFGSGNVLLQQDLRRLTRRVMNAMRENRQDVEALNEMVSLARTASDRSSSPAPQPTGSEAYLMYSHTND